VAIARYRVETGRLCRLGAYLPLQTPFGTRLSMGKKTNLKATLSKFQESQRRKGLQKAKEAAKKELTIKKAKKPSAKSKGKRSTAAAAQSNARTVPFKASDTILLVGEGNFSFARALFSSGHDGLAHLPPRNVTATTYDSEEACYGKYPDARGVVGELRGMGVVVLFGVDARRLGGCKELRKRRWQRIVWNFPHAGVLGFGYRMHRLTGRRVG
jgi:25S rRNA (uracil2634-N3)-methyltransferase